MLLDSHIFIKAMNGIKAGTLSRWYNNLKEADAKLKTIPHSKRGSFTLKTPREVGSGVYRVDELT